MQHAGGSVLMKKDALAAYTQTQKELHTNFILTNASLFISTERPYVGALSDGIVTCQCCGKDIVEVKCHLLF